MKLLLNEGIQIYIATKPVDMRKMIDGLSVLTAELNVGSLQTGHLFVFYNQSRDKVKVLFWDKNGFVVYYKRLSRGKFKIQRSLTNEHIEIEQPQLEWLLAGLDFTLMREFPELDFQNYF